MKTTFMAFALLATSATAFANMQLSSNTLDARILAGGSYQSSVHVKNIGADKIRVFMSNRCGAVPYLELMGWCNRDLLPQESCEVVIGFNPRQAGQWFCSVLFTDNLGMSEVLNITATAH